MGEEFIIRNDHRGHGECNDHTVSSAHSETYYIGVQTSETRRMNLVCFNTRCGNCGDSEIWLLVTNKLV